MNNLLKGITKPGVYNMDATIYTKTSEESSQSGIWMKIKPGAMLVFCNGYSTNNGVLSRDLSLPGSYMVKCVWDGTEDEDIQLANFETIAKEMTLDSNSSVGVGYPRIPEAFVVATFVYRDDAVSFSKPSFSLRVPSYNEITTLDESYRLPNEDYTPQEADTDVSYLIIGSLLYNGNYPAPFASGTAWRTDGRVGDAEWLKSYVFTGRGFSDYKGAVSKSYGAHMPGIVFARDYGKWYLTSGQFIFNSILSKIDGADWKRLYGQGYDSPGTYTLSTSSGSSIDYVYNNAVDLEYQNNQIASLAPHAGKTILDIFFLAIRSEYARAVTTGNLTEILTNSSYTITRRIVPLRLIVDSPVGQNIDASVVLAETYGLPAGTLNLPLDISSSNIERLKTFIANKNLILPIIDYMRQNAALSPFLNPSMGESLIPVAMSIRQVNALGTGYTDPATTPYRSALQSYQITQDATTNPSNVLGFFELQNSAFAILGTSFVAQEVFDTLPFLD